MSIRWKRFPSPTRRSPLARPRAVAVEALLLPLISQSAERKLAALDADELADHRARIGKRAQARRRGPPLPAGCIGRDQRRRRAAHAIRAITSHRDVEIVIAQDDRAARYEIDLGADVSDGVGQRITVNGH